MDTVLSETIGFNPDSGWQMHLDINSCFATIEQQANPLLRGKPVAVAAYTTGNGCILAASREAKLKGVKTGMPVRIGKELCHNLYVIAPDPEKYRYINHKLFALLSTYTPEIEVKSIDEMVMSFRETPVVKTFLQQGFSAEETMVLVSKAIKERIKSEIGDWITVSIGIAPNRYLAKLASSIRKPDGLLEIHKRNVEDVLETLALEDLVGIKYGNGSRLRCFGINSAVAFYRADITTLRKAFHSVVGYHWWLRLHGWEADDREFSRKTIGHSHALRIPYTPDQPELWQVLAQLVLKMGKRLRDKGYTARGIHVSCHYKDHTYWHHGKMLPTQIYADSDLYAATQSILSAARNAPVRILAINCYALAQNLYQQQSLLETEQKKARITQALDAITNRWGQTVITSGRMMNTKLKVLDRIAFGGGRGLQEKGSEELNGFFEDLGIDN